MKETSASLLDTGTIIGCWAHLINDGITVNEDSATIEWQGTGPGANASPPLPFQCRLLGVTTFQQCMFVRGYIPLLCNFEGVILCDTIYTVLTGTSPYSVSTSGLSSGTYSINIRYEDPDRLVCTNRNLASFDFLIITEN